MIATHSVGSLIEEYKPRDFILLDQVIDRTQKRNLTYYDNKDTSFKGVYHASFGDPYDTKLRQVCLRIFFRHYVNDFSLVILLLLPTRLGQMKPGTSFVTALFSIITCDTIK